MWRSPDLAIGDRPRTASTPDVRVEGDFEEDARGPLYVAHPDLGSNSCARHTATDVLEELCLDTPT